MIFFNAKTVTISTSCCHVAPFFIFFILYFLCVCVWVFVVCLFVFVVVVVVVVVVLVYLFVCALIFEVAASDIKPCFAVMQPTRLTGYQLSGYQLSMNAPTKQDITGCDSTE